MKKKTGKTADTDDDVKKDDEEQSQRFIEAAEELNSDKSGKAFRKAFESVKQK